MSQAVPPHEPPPAVESELLLEDMGYQASLQRGLNLIGNLALTLSDITPTASLLVVGTAVIATAGTGSVARAPIGEHVHPPAHGGRGWAGAGADERDRRRAGGGAVLGQRL